MKQTAVEWLTDNLHYLHSTKWDDILEQAKAMEKQQMMYAYNSDRDLLSRIEDGSASKEYYNETYGGKDEL
jgi:hypothetical protein